MGIMHVFVRIFLGEQITCLFLMLLGFSFKKVTLIIAGWLVCWFVCPDAVFFEEKPVLRSK